MAGHQEIHAATESSVRLFPRGARSQHVGRPQWREAAREILTMTRFWLSEMGCCNSQHVCLRGAALRCFFPSLPPRPRTLLYATTACRYRLGEVGGPLDPALSR